MYGASTGRAPIQVSKRTLTINHQNRALFHGLKELERRAGRGSPESTKRITTLNKSAITPPSLLGIDRKIAYANKKYHSG